MSSDNEDYLAHAPVGEPLENKRRRACKNRSHKYDGHVGRCDKCGAAVFSGPPPAASEAQPITVCLIARAAGSAAAMRRGVAHLTLALRSGPHGLGENVLVAPGKPSLRATVLGPTGRWQGDYNVNIRTADAERWIVDQKRAERGE